MFRPFSPDSIQALIRACCLLFRAGLGIRRGHFVVFIIRGDAVPQFAFFQASCMDRGNPILVLGKHGLLDIQPQVGSAVFFVRPWQWKQWSERIGRISLAKSTSAARKLAGVATARKRVGSVLI